MTEIEKIRTDAKEALGNWLGETLKKQIDIYYKMFRSFNLTASDSIACAREMVTENFNEFGKEIFYGVSPH